MWNSWCNLDLLNRLVFHVRWIIQNRNTDRNIYSLSDLSIRINQKWKSNRRSSLWWSIKTEGHRSSLDPKCQRKIEETKLLLRRFNVQHAREKESKKNTETIFRKRSRLVDIDWCFPQQFWLNNWRMKLFEDSSSFQVGQQFDDMFGHWWWSGQMITSGLETVLIGHPVDSQNDTIGIGERVTSLGNGSALFGRLADLLLRSTLLHFDTVLALKSVSNPTTHHRDHTNRPLEGR